MRFDGILTMQQLAFNVPIYIMKLRGKVHEHKYQQNSGYPVNKAVC
jgi:hypothetical protein